ncbi:MAG: lysophospholipid acyltransferase family protein [Pseudomonadota bacterium]
MSSSVLGRNPFETLAQGTPAATHSDLDMTAGTSSKKDRPDGAKPARAGSTTASARTAARASKRKTRTRSEALSASSRKAVAGVVREAQAARRARVGQTASPGLAGSPAVASLREDSWHDDNMDHFGMSGQALARAEPLLRFLYEEYFRVGLSMAEAVPDQGRALVVANHAGSLPLDALMLMTGLRRSQPSGRQVRALVEDAVWHAPFVGLAMGRLGGVRADQDNAERLLKQDQLVVVFPEGQKGLGKLYRDRYKLQRFGRGGFVKLAMRTGSPIVPAAVIGSEEIYPLLGKITRLVKTLGVPYLPITPTFPWLGVLGVLPLPTKWQVTFGEPLEMSRYAEQDCQDIALVNSITEQVRERIQDMLNAQLATRQSILFG